MNDGKRTARLREERLDITQPAADAIAAHDLPENIFRYIFKTSGLHQPLLVLLTVGVFLLEFVPLELQRRIVNDLVKHHDYKLVIVLCGVYLGVVFVQGGAKLLLNIYRGWVGERATRHLRRMARTLSGAASSPQANGVEISVIVTEVEPIGGFVGASISEPLLQGGILLTVTAYIVHLEPWMALAAVAIFAPQLIVVPLMQHAINRRAAARVRVLRGVSVGIIEGSSERGEDRDRSIDTRINRLFDLNMGIFRFKFSMNFVMNLCNHSQVIAALLIGGWFVVTDRLEIGGVVAFISAIGRLNDPWGDLVNYFRDLSATQIKFRLVADAVNRLGKGQTPSIAM